MVILSYIVATNYPILTIPETNAQPITSFF